MLIHSLRLACRLFSLFSRQSTSLLIVLPPTPPSCLACPHLAGSPRTLHISSHAEHPISSALTQFQRASLATFCRRSFCIRTKPAALERCHFDRVQHQHVKPSSICFMAPCFAMAVTAELQTAGKLSLVHIFALHPLVVLHVLHIILLLERAQMPVQAHFKIIALCVYVYQDNCSVCLCMSRQLF